MAPLHGNSFIDFYRERFASPVSVFCFIFWCCNIVAMIGISWCELKPLTYMTVQTGLGVMLMTVSHLELVWLPAHLHARRKQEAHPLAQL